MRLASAVVVVTGASRGIGRATARELAARGAIVVCVARDAVALQHVVDEVGGSALALDVAAADSGERIVAHALATHGRLDAVVVNAGVGYAGPFAQMPTASIAELVKLNVTAPMTLARAAIGALQQAAREGGSAAIVFMSSIAGAVGVPGEAVYSATKAAVNAFAVTLGEELHDDGITVSVVLPGVVATDFLQARGVAYDRRWPRPMPAQRVARVAADLLETGRTRRIEPRWLTVPARMAQITPGLYRTLARRFG